MLYTKLMFFFTTKEKVIIFRPGESDEWQKMIFGLCAFTRQYFFYIPELDVVRRAELNRRKSCRKMSCYLKIDLVQYLLYQPSSSTRHLSSPGDLELLYMSLSP